MAFQSFMQAVPVWEHEPEERLNRQLIFRETVDSLRSAVLKVAAADFYRLTVNGQFAAYGPARTTVGYARVDEIDLSAYDRAGENEILLEVAGYDCGSLSTCRQRSFLAAELFVNGASVRHTGRDFPAWVNVRREQHVERLSVQRHFMEQWDMRLPLMFAPEERVTLAAVEPAEWLARGVPYPEYPVREIAEFVSRGTYVQRADFTGVKLNAYSFDMAKEPDWGFFRPEKIADKPYRFVTTREQTVTQGAGCLPQTVRAGGWLMADMGRIECGFIRLTVRAEEETDLVLAMSELCDGDTFAFSQINIQSVIAYHLAAGEEYELQSFEPYTFRQTAVFVRHGCATISRIGVRTLEHGSKAIERTFRDPGLNAVYNAALRTFKHNAVDILTDCPSRERAGWLCDSFFTGRAEHFLYGESPVETAYLENYRLYRNEGEFPRGVLPMCYPSDPHNNNKFIPQWDMWYVLEVCEYLEMRRPDVDRELFRESVTGLMEFFARHENELGLLEKLPSWNFIEWSDANTWTQDVSWPTNMLYAGVLEAAGRVFGLAGAAEKAERIRKTVAEMAFDGEVFLDHAMRCEDGTLRNYPHVSEAAQYYAILFGGVDLHDGKYEALRRHVVEDFADFVPGERQFCPKNAFIGLYLRMNVLMNMGDGALLKENVLNFCSGMARDTETLWEYKQRRGSYNHGFAAYIAMTIPFADGQESAI